MYNNHNNSKSLINCTYKLRELIFADNQIDIIYKNISDKQNRNELIKKYNRIDVPTIIIENKIFLGFADNRYEIIGLLKTMK